MSKSLTIRSAVMVFLVTLFTGQAIAGGLVDLEGGVFNPADSMHITNPWWPQTPGEVRTLFAVEGEECIYEISEVLGVTAINGIPARIILDEGWLDTDCDGVVDELIETTYDWYAQDVDGNVWYMGEDTIAFDLEECDYVANVAPWGDVCKDGSWEDGDDVLGAGEDAERGILMLAEPGKGDFYAQETYPDVAEDMGKVLNFKKVNGPLIGQQTKCLVTKEWNPLEPGAVEHKYYCFGIGLVLVEEHAGGKTVWVDLISVFP